MKRTFLILLLILVSVLPAMAAGTEPYIFFYDTDRQYKINMNMDFFPARINANWNDYSFDTGAAGKFNWLGNLDFDICDYAYKVTIETNGRMVSQSNPSLYREFHIGAAPHYRIDKDYGYARDVTNMLETTGTGESTKTLDSRIPTTKGTNSLVVYVPSISTLRAQYGDKAFRFYYDIYYYADVLNAQDYLHIEEADDYYSTVYVKWECLDPDHSELDGSAVIELRGFYDTDDPRSWNTFVDNDTAFININPEPSAYMLNLKQIMFNGEFGKLGSEKIATMSINSLYRQNHRWTYDQYIRIFLSSSSNYSDQGTIFELVNMKDMDKKIPFTVRIVDSSTGTTLKMMNRNDAVYDGTTSYKKNKKNWLDLSSYVVTQKSKDYWYGKNIEMYAVSCDADVLIEIDNSPNGVDNKIFNYDELADYSGVYSEDIYSHII